jgi:methionine-rich copper-binding protein CopC
MRALLTFTAAVLVVAAFPASAHPKLVSTTPGANAIVSPVSQITIVFSEPLIEKLSKVSVSMAMAEMGPMAMPGTTSLSKDGKTLSVTYATPLHSGGYKVEYQVVSTDTHKAAGNFAFRVR